MAAKPPYARDGFEQTIKTMEVKKLFIKNVRCFEGKKEFNIRPLTFLVGENSTGKSTALGCMQALHYGMERSLDIREAREDVFDGFNISPHEMGTFTDIVRKKASPRQFVLGFGLQSGDLAYTHSLTFQGDLHFGILIVKKEWEFNNKNGKTVGKITMTKEPGPYGTNLSKGARKNHFSIKAGDVPFSRFGYDINYLIERFRPITLRDRYRDPLARETTERTAQKELVKFLKDLPSFNEEQHDFVLRPPRILRLAPFYSIPPVRSTPKRNYDPIAMNETPQGNDIPVLLMKMSLFDGLKWEELRGRLNAFGNASGMFDDIEVKAPHDASSAFQLHFTVRGTKANMKDIGYGVSQVLPILVRIFTKENSTFLMQQPEVHLHPQAQAELLSLLTSDILERNNRYVLETHSDYMLDRARIEIMKGKLDPEYVSLIYLEPAGDKVAVHNITFDKEGNFINAPGSYREFFNKEAHKLLGF